MTYKIEYKSANKIDDIQAVIWDCESPKALLQIAHGMSEYIDRYEDFAKFLNTKGIAVAGNNHLGHGPAAKTLGYFGEGEVCEYLIDDMKYLSDYLQDRYSLPVYYLGHSMGSFILRYFLSKYPAEKAVLMGTGYVDKRLASLLVKLSRHMMKRHGEKYDSKLLYMMTVGAYQLRVPKGEIWLSKNLDNVMKYKDDPYCGFNFTAGGYEVLGELLKRIVDEDIISRTSKDVEMLFVSGSEDAVGDMEKGVIKVHDFYKKLGYENLEVEFFENMRHEILNEKDNIKVYNRIYEFLKTR
ncbi:MAG: alpha/beta hydrolase [Peptoniphilus sp.]|nr:alpha/beta hydrolase [Peptoniphilus sp.]